MNKSKTDCKKQIIRNTEDAKPKTVVIKLPEESKSTEIETAETSTPKEVGDAAKVAEISEPKLNTALCVTKQIKQVADTKQKKIKSLSDLSKLNRITFDEKVTKKVNFPLDKRLYKELISLQLVDKPILQNVPITHEPAVKDRVPRLEDFYIPTQKKEYSIPVNSILNHQPILRQYNGFRLQQVINSWHKDHPD